MITAATKNDLYQCASTAETQLALYVGMRLGLISGFGAFYIAIHQLSIVGLNIPMFF
jgi:hypothetical protein